MNIKNTLETTGLTADELAVLCDVTRSMIYKWMQGAAPHRLRVPRLIKLEQAFTVAVADKALPLSTPVARTKASKDARILAIKTIVVSSLKKIAAAP